MTIETARRLVGTQMRACLAVPATGALGFPVGTLWTLEELVEGPPLSVIASIVLASGKLNLVSGEDVLQYFEPAVDCHATDNGRLENKKSGSETPCPQPIQEAVTYQGKRIAVDEPALPKPQGIRQTDHARARADRSRPSATPMHHIQTQLCPCRKCITCSANQRWEQIFLEKFADPGYYTRSNFKFSSSLAGL
jgi:hypothetical protein